VWTTRLIRGILNASLVFLAAPLVARLYDAPVLTHALRIISINFVLMGTESMSFILAQRNRKARISNYADFGTNLATTLFVVIIANRLHNYYALIYGMIFQRCLTVAISYMFYRDIGVGLAFDREAMADQWRFARFVMPSSILTIILSQYDKLVLLKLFNLTILGYYGIAQNMLGPITGVVMHNARVVLYARCADYYRSDPTRVLARFYSENGRLLTLGVLLPASVAGFANAIIQFLYDARYSIVGSILTILGLGGVIAAFHHASENLLVAVGRTHVVLVANIIRLCTIVPASLAGYYMFGFYGFLWFNFGASIVLLLFFYYEQKKLGLLNIGKEMRLFSLGAATFLLFWGLSYLVLFLSPSSWLHIGPKRA
jgi:O-antigen/teichoic acid export membrane protein